MSGPKRFVAFAVAALLILPGTCKALSPFAADWVDVHSMHSSLSLLLLLWAMGALRWPAWAETAPALPTPIDKIG